MRTCLALVCIMFFHFTAEPVNTLRVGHGVQLSRRIAEMLPCLGQKIGERHAKPCSSLKRNQAQASRSALPPGLKFCATNSAAIVESLACQPVTRAPPSARN